MDIERLNRQFEFFREIDKEKNIIRQTYLADGSRQETDSEHAWQMAVMTLLLAEYSNTEIDKFRTISMILVHDLVEVYAGDTYAYDEEAKKTQRERELKSAEKLFSILPQDQAKYIRELWDEFEEQKTPEAKFAKTMDNIQPVMLNIASKGRAWKEHSTRLSQILKRQKNTKDGSKVLWEYEKETFLKPAVENGMVIKDTEFPEE